ncbi:hypothetical protein OWR28_24105 [Chryseobacterium sp. 1B4]
MINGNNDSSTSFTDKRSMMNDVTRFGIRVPGYGFLGFGMELIKSYTP